MNNRLNSSYRRAMLFALLGGAMFGNVLEDNRSYITDKPLKKCLGCGKMHDHNNSWCSAECCKKYREKEKLCLPSPNQKQK